MIGSDFRDESKSMLTSYSMTDTHKGVMRQITWWFTIIPVAYLLSLLSLHLVSKVEPERLIPVSADNMLQAVPLAFLCYLIGISLISRMSIIPNRVPLFTAIFLLRIVTAFVLSFLLQYDDERLFHAAGVEQRYGLFSWDAGRGYNHFVNIMYVFLWPNLLLPKVANAFVGSLLPFFAYDLAQRLFGNRKAAWRTFLLTAFLPPFVIFSAVNLKEVATAFLLVIPLWFLVVVRHSALLKIAGVACAIGSLYLLRGASWAAVPSTGLVVYLLLGDRWRLRQFVNAGWLWKVLLVAVVAVVASPLLIEAINKAIEDRLAAESYYTDRFANSSATVMQLVDVRNSLSPKNLGVLFLRGLYTPSPIRFLFDHGLGTGTIIEASVTGVWYLLFPFAIAGVLAERHKGLVIACGIMVFAVLAMAGMSVMFGSDPYRHRIAALGLVFTLAGGGYRKEIIREYRLVFYLWWLGALLFTVIWIVFRV